MASSIDSWDDPFPEIAAALLHSGQIAAYCRHNFSDGKIVIGPALEDRLKSASLEIMFGGAVYWWSDQGEYKTQTLTRENPYVLEPNQIVFIEPDVTFHLPPYLAIRFNLTIKLIHRGLLLGTGPLVDPGFKGKLLIPLHNLTKNKYVLHAEDHFIWVEFTKLDTSRIDTKPDGKSVWKSVAGSTFEYSDFPTNKRELKPINYFRKSNAGAEVRSSLIDELKSLEDQRSKLETTIRRLSLVSIVSLVLSVSGIFALIYSAQSFVNDVGKNLGDDVKRVADDLKKVSDESKDLARAQKELASRVDDALPSRKRHEK